MDQKIWVECSCDYEGFAVMVKPDGMKYKHPMCPNCGEFVDYDYIEYLSNDEFEKRINDL